MVRKGVFCGWKRIQREFPPGRTWEDLAGLIQGFPDVEDAVEEYFRLHPGRHFVKVFLKICVEGVPCKREVPIPATHLHPL